MSFNPARAEIRALSAYQRPASAGSSPIRAKLDFNESSEDVPEDVKSEVLGRVAARRWSLYPDFGAPRLKAKLAERIGRSPEEIVLGNGSGELLLAAVSVFAGCGGTILLAPPTFSLYGSIAAIAGAEVLREPRVGADFAIDEASFLARLGGRASTIPLVCSPNNPTGGVVSRDFVRALAGLSPVVLLDQAYVDFGEPGDDALPLLDELPNLVIFRTLSKAYAAAGLRIGYAIARRELAAEIDKGILPYNVDIVAEELALAMLSRTDVLQRRVDAVRRERTRVASDLAAMGAAVAFSRANFLFFAPPGGHGPRLHEALLSRGVLVRDLAASAPGFLRVTIGSPSENDLFLAMTREVL